MKTTHTTACKRVFKNYDMTCPRCQELAGGAKPRAGWNDAKDAEYARFKSALKAHDCTKSNCGPVCTAFDW